jgi:hypothetical protein
LTPNFAAIPRLFPKSSTLISSEIHDLAGDARFLAALSQAAWSDQKGVITSCTFLDGPLDAAANGLLKSGVFPGLWLDAAALLRGDKKALLAVLQRGLGSPEHGAFLSA